MSFQKSFTARILLFSLMAIAFSSMAFSQDEQVPLTVNEKPKRTQSIAGSNNLYCAGYIQSNAISTVNKIIGGQDEADKYIYAQNDFLYINMGNDKGVNVGDMFAVVRPRGAVKSKWSKKGDVGFYVQEVGSLEVVNVKREVSVVRVKTSCDNFLLGDLVQLVPQRTSPVFEQHSALNRFGDPSGKATGRILMARDGAEMLTRDYIAYVAPESGS